MSLIVFKHHRKTSNVGDRSCSPYDAFWKEDPNASAIDFTEKTPSDAATVIFGGGQIMSRIEKRFAESDHNARLRVAWGVGTRHRMFSWWNYRQAFKKMDLIGSRDWGDDRFTFVPCASCMSPLFDAPTAPKHDIVFFLHRWKTSAARFDLPVGYPTAYNDIETLDAAIQHIASGATVVSNSYHGVYWGLLLGRRVLCLPFSNKFMHYRISPGYSEPADWAKNIGRAKGSDEMRDICRSANYSFQGVVNSRINDTG